MKCKYMLLLFINFAICKKGHTGSSGLQLLTCWDCGFESCWWHGCMSVVSVVCCQGQGLCNKLITYPEESHWLWCIVVCDLETSRMKRLWPALGWSTTGMKREGHRIGSSAYCELWSHFGGIAPLFFDLLYHTWVSDWYWTMAVSPIW